MTELQQVPERVMTALSESFAELTAAFVAIGEGVRQVVAGMGESLRQLGARLWPEIHAEQARHAAAVARYRRRIARPPVIRTTSRSFRAGTRRTKRLAHSSR